MTRAMSESAATTMASNSDQTEDWCISIKTVGGGFDDDDHDEESNTATTSTNNSKLSSSSAERLFHVTVSPEDGVASLYQEIEEATGVKPSQQRLIYRGRIINDHPPLNGHDEEELDSLSTPKDLDIDVTGGGTSTNSAVVPTITTTSSHNAVVNNNDPRRRKIKDIVGLCDGQTIHLVKKRETSNNSSPSSRSSNSSTNGQNPSFEAAAADLLNGSTSSGGGNGGGAFLAALLGLGNLSDDGLESNGNGAGTENIATAIPATATSSWRSSRRSRRRPPYRLSAADLEVPDPGSMEPVRQGLMTLHTLLPHSELHRENGTSPLEANREWFRGQWLDCRDTVNQWLEATVVEIIRPQDILPLDAVADASRSTNSSASSIQRRQPVVDNDPAVSATDLEGRRRLLLEPCQPGDPLELSGDMLGYRPRSNNNGVQLLLIHYNGWPHRWDEWIRSDSERIRPFRTRTRHPNSSPTVSPTPQSVFSDAPRTNISIGNEERDRAALLPELSRAVSQVNALLSELVQRENPCGHIGLEQAQPTVPQRTDEDLPWVSSNGETVGPGDDESDDDDYITAEVSELQASEPQSNIVVPFREQNEESNITESSYTTTSTTQQYNQREIRHLAAVLDRLGRTLTDAAPHVASLAASLPEETSISSIQDHESSTEPEFLSEVEAPSPSAPLGGLLSLWSRERRRNNASSNTVTPSNNAASSLDPDHLDYASGLVNTTRGEVRSGSRGRSSQDDIANLLGAYLAAASLSGLVNSGNDNGDDDMTGLGRLLTRGGTGGGNGGGIDIHIHAVVTTGGNGVPTGTGLIGLGTGGALGTGGNGNGVGTPTGTVIGTTARNLFSANRPSRSLLRSRNNSTPLVNDDEDNEDLFSELYSENPSPVDPTASPVRGEDENQHGSAIRIVPSSASSDISSRGTFEDRPFGSIDSTPSRRTPRFSSVPRRQPAGRSSSGVFRLFRRRSRSSQSDGSTSEHS